MQHSVMKTSAQENSREQCPYQVITGQKRGPVCPRCQAEELRHTHVPLLQIELGL